MKKPELTKITEFRLKLHPKDFIVGKNFYQDILQFPIVHEWDNGEKDRGAMFDVGGTVLELITAKHGYRLPQGTDIALEVPDVHGLWEKLNGKAPVIFPPRDNALGDTSFRIADPDGFEITFFTKVTK